MADMTREQLQGAVMALEAFFDEERYKDRMGMYPIPQSEVDWAIDEYRAQLAAMPPEPDLRAALVEARAKLEPFALFERKFVAARAGAVRPVSEELYGIHTGTEFEAMLTHQHLRDADAAIASINKVLEVKHG